ncbi:DUF1961 family protein [Marinimicrobium alkaliphilum]|uniref:DUF1961 family protein n=1 Tax=Marinimicrobium alkaliphilum TaxID=2202654 RepID=UPI000DB98D03|nr:DUF1961 family protein [Marinimicrobium alkaliphilum]
MKTLRLWRGLAIGLSVCAALAGCSGTDNPELSERSASLAVKAERVVAQVEPDHHYPLVDASDTAGWVMEGDARVVFSDGWMEMFSPEQAAHHVYWLDKDLPESFIATWEVQNLAVEAGLLIVFFAAMGADGEDIFDPSLPARDGTFTQYTEGDIKSYHISYYANVEHEPGRSHANLRKNNTFSLLQSGADGIPTQSTDVHQLTLIKADNHIQMFVDDRLVIDYVDDQPVVEGVDTGPALGAGKLGLRQMQWSHFRYRDLKIWDLTPHL